MDKLAGNGEFAPVDVKVDPAKADYLGAPQTAQSDQPPQREQPVITDEGEELGQLLDHPYRHSGALAGAPPRGHPPWGPHHGVDVAWRR
ncbi:hypothetical protein ABZ897_45245 [Nonomuraea sp. NPDC046802]|uniref:hypothetical protein n=1 Tax=Nonomuraea sp. NPDC046802 TaxID=3154919 RepID=UPI0033E7ED1A